jgi:hypothetical protein
MRVEELHTMPTTNKEKGSRSLDLCLAENTL